MKPKENKKTDEAVSQKMDRCQTPPYALDPLRSYLDQFDTVWEPAVGEGQLMCALQHLGKSVVNSDILSGQNFFEYSPFIDYDCVITNPPFSIKYKWIERCYSLNKPFALLMPVEVIGAAKAQRLFNASGIHQFSYHSVSLI